MKSSTIERSLPFYEQAYQSIKGMIIRGQIQPGERVYEAKLAREFEVSRSPIREAVRVLIAEGLLVSDERSQIFVYQPTVDDVEHIYQCRMALESLAVKLTTLKASDDELDEIGSKLHENASLISSARDAETEKKLILLNGQFHDLIQQYSQNPRLQKQLGDLRTLSYYYRFKNFQGQHRAEVILKQHQNIFDLMFMRKHDQAAEAMEEHILNDLLHLKEIMMKEQNS